MKHLRWKLENILQFRPGAVMEIGQSKPLDVPVVTKQKTTYADIWIGKNQIWYRLEEGSLEGAQLQVVKREILITGDYAIYQDYNTRPTGSKSPLEPAWIRVIPTFGPADAFEVNLLQLPWDHLWIRSMFTGKLPVNYNGLPVNLDGRKRIYQNYSPDPDHVQTKALKLANYMEADYVDGKPSAVYEFNPWDGQMLRSFRDIQWRDGRIVYFATHEETKQARIVLRPRLTLACTLESENDEPCPIEFKKGAQVMDYRLCAPVPLNDFPAPSCPPKTYKYQGKLASLIELPKMDEA